MTCCLLIEAAPREKLRLPQKGTPKEPRARPDRAGLSAGANESRTLQQWEEHMGDTSLHSFATKVLKGNRLLFADLRRLERDVLPYGVRSRKEAEILISLDRLERVDAGWPPYLVGVLSEFVLSQSQSCGGFEPVPDLWLSEMLLRARSRTAEAVLRTIRRGKSQLSARTAEPALESADA